MIPGFSKGCGGGLGNRECSGREPITGVWGIVRASCGGSECEAGKLPDVESFSSIFIQKRAEKKDL